MDISEVMHESGIYRVPVEDLPEWQVFIREDDRHGEARPLLHVCERELLARENNTHYACITGRTVWNSFYGRYECIECEKKFTSDEELKMVWMDGKGTGYEGHA
jgi:hypothetical protein